MRRTGILAAGLLIGMTGVAAASLTYQPGPYNVDPCSITTVRPCSQDDNGRLRMTVRRGHFTVQRISLTETCSNGVRSVREPFTFRAGTNARLSGGISSEGCFSGRFEDPAGFVKVIGTVRGQRLELDVMERGTFTVADEPTFHCAGFITFHARRS